MDYPFLDTVISVWEPVYGRPAVRKSDEPLEDVVTSPNGFLVDKDSGGMFYAIRLAQVTLLL